MLTKVIGASKAAFCKRPFKVTAHDEWRQVGGGAEGASHTITRDPSCRVGTRRRTCYVWVCPALFAKPVRDIFGVERVSVLHCVVCVLVLCVWNAAA